MDIVQGRSPELCLHDGHIFDNWLCPQASTLDKVAIVVFHVFTACIPLIIYYCAQYAILLMEYDSPVESPLESPQLPPNSAIQALFQSRVLASNEELPEASSARDQTTVARRLSFNREDSESDEELAIPEPLNREVSRAPSPFEELGLSAPLGADDWFFLGERAFNYLVDFLDDKLIERESEKGDVEVFWNNLTAKNLKRLAVFLLSEKDVQYSEEELAQFIETNLDRTFLALRFRSEIRDLKRGLCKEAIEFTDARSELLEPFDWSTLEIGPTEDDSVLITLPPREDSSDLDSDGEAQDRLLLVRPVPDLISQNYSLYLQKYVELEAMLTPKINMPNPLDQAQGMNKAFELLQVAYTIGLRSLYDIEEYTVDTDENELDGKDHIAILTSSALHHSRAFLLCGQLYHLIREKSYYSAELQRMVGPQDLPAAWSQSFYKEVSESVQAKMRFLYNQFCQEIVSFLGEEVWEEYFLEHCDHARWYCPDDPSMPYRSPNCMLNRMLEFV